MNTLLDVLRSWRQLTPAEVAGRHRSPLLLHRLSAAGGGGFSAETQFARPISEDASAIAAEMLSMGVETAKGLAHLNRVASTLGAVGPQPGADRSIVVFATRGPVGPEGLSIGRAPEAAFCLPYAKVSKVHARLLPRGDCWVIIDGGSRNGTQLNGVPIAAGVPTALKEGAMLQFSQYQFLFYTPAGLYRVLRSG